MHIAENERTALFIDGPNLYAAARTLGFDIDFKTLLMLFRQRSRLVRALYYTPLGEDHASLRPLIDWLDYNGYTVVTKPAKDFTDAAGQRRLKGSVAVEIAVDAMLLAAGIDHAVLFSGDGDYRRLVETLQELGRRVTVVSSIATQPPLLADELRRQADQFVELADLAPIIGRERRISSP